MNYYLLSALTLLTLTIVSIIGMKLSATIYCNILYKRNQRLADDIIEDMQNRKSGTLEWKHKIDKALSLKYKYEWWSVVAFHRLLRK